jgi:nucleotide-binding universal stress UspA family protein
MKLLLPTDGSNASLQAIRFLLGHRHWFAQPLELHLLNVQQSLRGDVGRFVGQGEVRSFHHDEGMKLLALARAALDAAGAPYAFHVSVGDDAGALIARFAREQPMDLIVIGKKGQSALAGLLLGSVAATVARVSSVPVLLVGG